MLRNLPLPEGSTFTWVDLVDPTTAEMAEVAERYGLHPAAVRDLLNQPHLPKYERLPGQQLLILRAYDELAKRGDTIQAMTRRLVVLMMEGVIITVHRREQPFFAEAAQRAATGQALRPEQLVLSLCARAVKSFDEPLKESEEKLDQIEATLFNRKVPHLGIKQIYGLKRRCAVIKRTLGRITTALGPFKEQVRDDQGLLADVVEEADRLHTWADELLENATHLMNLEINLASQRTNEVMRVLTVFSAFFLPLTFIAGVYGMNFKRMPELEHRLGYPLVIGAMLLTALAIWAWFRRKGWLR
ncbi:CorA family divalent cation transporter [Geothrix edaphica]|uniref:Magnesium transport protein CorA n=1 Tax=Geothrix edaphica TaxID=2927976 RepID=A0ABQ5PWK6_9BACT|nr:CorA family divalent cation transporter [Geothrix edaphica]GLH66777.1 magnesium transport protein CorA [Geothrix edaphica]